CIRDSLGAVLSLTLIGLPLVYVGSIMLVLWRVDKDLHSNSLRALGRLLCRIKTRLMGGAGSFTHLTLPATTREGG
ncbi:hypothetical protein ACQ4LF_25095, partial [Aeromonas salmonicida]